MAPDVGLAKGTRVLWKDELLLDYTIEVGDEQFKVHKVTIASVSDYFRVLLTGGLAESKMDSVRLEGLSALVVSNMINFMYTGEFGSPKAGPEELLGAAVYLQIESAVKACTDLLFDEINLDNCLNILSSFKTYSVKDGIKRTTRYIQANMDNILETGKLNEMTCGTYVDLMDCWGRSEWDLVKNTIQWLNVDFDERKEHVNEVMSHIRFSLLSPAEIRMLKKKYHFLDFDGPWCELVENALLYHDLPMHQKVLDESDQSRVRSEPSPVTFVPRSKGAHDIYALHEGKFWKTYKSVNKPKISFGRSHIEANNFLIVCGRLAHSNKQDRSQWYIFDPRTRTWSEMAALKKPRPLFGLVYHEKHLYALGGEIKKTESRIIERYDFETNTWSVIRSKLPEGLSEPRAFSIGAFIYVAFGITHSGKNHLSSVNCLDLRTDTWTKKASLEHAYDLLMGDLKLVELHGEPVLADFDAYFKLHYYKPSTDQWLIYNLHAPSTIQWREGDGTEVLGKGDQIFFVNIVRNHLYASPVTGIHEYEQVERSCEKWTLRDEGPMIDASLDRYPENMPVSWESMSTLLSLRYCGD